jgi:hypothetical protein
MKGIQEVLKKFEETVSGRSDALNFLREFEGTPVQIAQHIADFDASYAGASHLSESYLSTLKHAVQLSQSEPPVKFKTTTYAPAQAVKWMSKFPVSVIRLFFETAGSEKAIRFALENQGRLTVLADRVQEVELEIAEVFNENLGGWMSPTASPRMVKDGYLSTLKAILQALSD